MGILLEASNQERKLRACIRGAATLEEALEASLSFGGFEDVGSDDDFCFKELSWTFLNFLKLSQTSYKTF